MDRGKYSFSSHRKQSAGFKPGNMAAFIYGAISEESGIDASIETFKNFLKDNDMMPESEKSETSVKDIFGTTAKYMEFHEGWVRTSCRLNRAVSNPNRILIRRYLQ